jgi:hypothetical protein
MKLTQRKRYRAIWGKVVLQVEEEYEVSDGRGGVSKALRWRDARVEDISLIDEIVNNDDIPVAPKTMPGYRGKVGDIP